MPRTLDITPSPRVLRMLGQIDFAPWQCLAELIDNSIDAFIDARALGVPIPEPRVAITLPNAGALGNGGGTLVIEDNASGMTVDKLGDAVRAGYSGNDPVDKMGLFGMGFNIATARLGRRTEVWTTTAEAPEWTALVVDFDELERQRAFHAPLITRAKTRQELDERSHGTRIEVSRLEPDRIRPLIHGLGKNKTKQRLGKIYGRVMEERGVAILYDGDLIRPRRHCVWDASRAVPTADFGNVYARISIDEALPARRFCTTCWVWLGDLDHECSACGSADHVVERARRLVGWIGVQRYFDKSEFGIDLIRNGRVIEELDKSFFTYRDPSGGDDVFEYPRDAVHWGGRIVGELEVDFVRVSHQKDAFDKLDPEWRQVVKLVRGESPLQPKIAERMGLPRNVSPLARLFAGYRKGIAGLKNLVPGDATGVGLNSGLVLDYVDKFHAGDPEYQSDEKWYQLVLQAERSNRGGSSGAGSAGGPLPLAGGAAPQVGQGGAGAGVAGVPPGGARGGPAPTRAAAPDDEPDAVLSQLYELTILGAQQTVQVAAVKKGGVSAGAPFGVQPDGFKLRYEFFPNAPFFEASLATPTDVLLVELAHHFLAVSAASPRQMPVSLIVHDLRRKYFPKTLTDATAAADEAEAILNELRGHYDEALSAIAPIDENQLEPTVLAKVRKRAFQDANLTEEQAMDAIRRGQFARYVDNARLLLLVKRWPDLAGDGAFFTLPLTGVAPEVREGGVSSLTQSLGDVRWLADEASGAVSKDKPWRLQFSRALASLRLLQSWRV